MKQGAADKSYGVHVAQLAEMPDAIIERARVLLEQFESKDWEPSKKVKEDALQLSLFEETEKRKEAENVSGAEREVLERLEKMNIMGTSPIQAINVLYELQQTLLNKK